VPTTTAAAAPPVSSGFTCKTTPCAVVTAAATAAAAAVAAVPQGVCKPTSLVGSTQYYGCSCAATFLRPDVQAHHLYRCCYCCHCCCCCCCCCCLPYIEQGVCKLTTLIGSTHYYGCSCHPPPLQQLLDQTFQLTSCTIAAAAVQQGVCKPTSLVGSTQYYGCSCTLQFSGLTCKLTTCTAVAPAATAAAAAAVSCTSSRVFASQPP
jgi:hypothetical protein